MKLLTVVTLCSILASSSLYAEEKTRVQVYAELIAAQQNGLQDVTDTSYPEINPSLTKDVEWQKQRAALANPSRTEAPLPEPQ
jgi:hypothetical protein